MHLFIATAITLLSWSIEQSCGRICSSQIVTDFSSTVDSSTQVLSGDLQLLVPAWKLNNKGYIYLWQAIVQGSVSSSAIEFQIFRPNSKMNNVYDLVYGNMYNHYQEQIGNRVSINVNGITSPPEIPIKPGYIIGLRLKNNIPGADPNFGLQYSNSTTGAGAVDVYYWQGKGSQACSLSLSDPNAGVLRGITPLVSWTFCGLIFSNVIIRHLFAIHKQSNPLICSLSSSTPNPVTPNIPTVSPSPVLPLSLHDQSPSSLFPTPKPISSTIAVPHSSISPTPIISKEMYIKCIPLAVGVAILLFLLTTCTAIVLLKRKYTRRKCTDSALNIEPAVQYDELLSIQNGSTVLRPASYVNGSVIEMRAMAVEANIPYYAQTSTSHDISNEVTRHSLRTNLPMQDHSLSPSLSTQSNRSIGSSFPAAVDSKEMRITDNVAYGCQDIVVENNVAYAATIMY